MLPADGAFDTEGGSGGGGLLGGWGGGELQGGGVELQFEFWLVGETGIAGSKPG